MSGRLMRAASSVPATNPNCTASVSPEAPEESRCHSSRRAGAEAEALNQSVMPSSSAVEMSRSARQRAVLCMRLGFAQNPIWNYWQEEGSFTILHEVEFYSRGVWRETRVGGCGALA